MTEAAAIAVNEHVDPKAIATARRNIEDAGLAPFAEIDQADFFYLHPPGGIPVALLIHNA